MGLLVLQHLNPVLPPPQVVIGAGQFRGAVGRHMPRLLQGDEGLQRARGAQVRVPPAEDQLLGLDEELDLPDAAPAQLQVRPRRREPVIHLVDVDLALDGMDVGNGGEVQAAPPDEGLQRGQEPLPRQRVPGADPGLDHGGPFPVLSDALVIFQGRGHGHGRRRRGRVGSQAQVDAEDIAVLGPLLQQIGQGPGQAQGHRRRLAPLRHRQQLRHVEDGYVDVAGIVELEGPLLAQGQAEQAGGRAAGPVLGKEETPPVPLHRGRHGQGRLHRRVGKPGQRPGDGIQSPDPAKVAQGGQQVQLRLQMAKRGPGRVRIAGGDLAGAGQKVRQQGVGIGVQQRGQQGRRAPHDAAEIGGRPGNRCQGRAHGGIGDRLQHRPFQHPGGQGGIGHGAAGTKAICEGHPRRVGAAPRAGPARRRRAGRAPPVRYRPRRSAR